MRVGQMRRQPGFLTFAELGAKSEPTKVAEEAAPEPVVPAEAIDDKFAYAPPWARRDRTVTERQQHSGPSEGDIAPAFLRVKSPAERGGVRGYPSAIEAWRRSFCDIAPSAAP